jgi:hypothetical protein
LKPKSIKLDDTMPIIPQEVYNYYSPIYLTVMKLLQRVRTFPAQSYIFVGEPTELQDLIDFWNLRALGNKIWLFLPISHYKELKSQIQAVYEMYEGKDRSQFLEYPVLLFSRNVEGQEKTILDWIHQLVPNAQVIQDSLSSIFNYRLHRNTYAYEDTHQFPIMSVNGRLDFPTHLPVFFKRDRSQATGQRFWFVDLSFGGFFLQHNYLPNFPRDPGIEKKLPRNLLGQMGRITDEGLSIISSPLYHSHIMVSLPKAFEAISAIFEHRGMRIEFSKPGHITQQIMQSLGGIHDCRIFKLKAVRDALELLNDGKAHPVDEILQKIGEGLRGLPDDFSIIQGKRVAEIEPQDRLTIMHQLGMIQQGWELECKTCYIKEWHPIGSFGDKFTCPRCFTEQQTPRLDSPFCSYFLPCQWSLLSREKNAR